MQDFSSEFAFIASRSSGKGGQNVNKVATKVELRFDVTNSALLTQEEKDKILLELANRINNDGILIIQSDRFRTQLANKKAVINKFYELLGDTLKAQKKRKPTRPSRASKENRLSEKKKRSTLKDSRKNIDPENS